MERRNFRRWGRRIFVREGKELVGPFLTRHDAARFIFLIELSGVSSAGIDVVEIEGKAAPQRHRRPLTAPGYTLRRGTWEKPLA